MNYFYKTAFKFENLQFQAVYKSGTHLTANDLDGTYSLHSFYFHALVSLKTFHAHLTTDNTPSVQHCNELVPILEQSGKKVQNCWTLR